MGDLRQNYSSPSRAEGEIIRWTLRIGSEGRRVSVLGATSSVCYHSWLCSALGEGRIGYDNESMCHSPQYDRRGRTWFIWPCFWLWAYRGCHSRAQCPMGPSSVLFSISWQSSISSKPRATCTPPIGLDWRVMESAISATRIATLVLSIYAVMFSFYYFCIVCFFFSNRICLMYFLFIFYVLICCMFLRQSLILYFCKCLTFVSHF